MIKIENISKVFKKKVALDNVILEFNNFIECDSKYFEDIKTHEDFYKLTKSEIEDKISEYTSKTTKLNEIKGDFEEKKLVLENVTDAKKLLNDINHQITAVID